MGSPGGTLALQLGSAPGAATGRNKGRAPSYWLPLVLLFGPTWDVGHRCRAEIAV